MQLSKKNSSAIHSQAGLVIPEEKLFTLPEKVIQFGTGVLLRGLPDYFIDKANRQGIFNGRIVVVKSTATGGADAFDQQDGLYTLCIRGIEQGRQVEENLINASISRVVSAATQWEQVLQCAANPAMTVVISNTTEVGITLVKESIHAAPPASFPAKLLAFLYKRYKTFNGDRDRGMVIVPTELVTDNGKKLKEILLELSRFNELEQLFTDWLLSANYFCNTLVDRIVPGKLPAAEQEKTAAALGYTDELMIMSEVYRLWAIETDSEKAKALLSFSEADEGVVITGDITKFKELKLRLLNGSHTFTCAWALVNGFTTVKEAMADKAFGDFIQTLMQEEIIPAITGEIISQQEAETFAANVRDRYRNPFLEHQWISISVQYTSKMRMRNVPLIQAYYQKLGKAPLHMATGFAAYLLFMQSEQATAGVFTGRLNGKIYTINDQYADTLYNYWQQHQGLELVKAVLADEILWETNLDQLPGFAEAIQEQLDKIKNDYFSDLLQAENKH